MDGQTSAATLKRRFVGRRAVPAATTIGSAEFYHSLKTRRLSDRVAFLLSTPEHTQTRPFARHQETHRSLFASPAASTHPRSTAYQRLSSLFLLSSRACRAIETRDGGAGKPLPESGTSWETRTFSTTSLPRPLFLFFHLIRRTRDVCIQPRAERLITTRMRHRENASLIRGTSEMRAVIREPPRARLTEPRRFPSASRPRDSSASFANAPASRRRHQRFAAFRTHRSCLRVISSLFLSLASSSLDLTFVEIRR